MKYPKQMKKPKDPSVLAKEFVAEHKHLMWVLGALAIILEAIVVIKLLESL